MSIENEIHEYQRSILRELLFKPHARFRDLKKFDIPNDHFSFHLNQLVDSGLVIKENNTYILSATGKEFANRIDTDSLKFEKQAKVAVALHAVRVRDGQREYLLHQRLKEPYYGWWGTQSGKIRWGDTPLDTAKREFLEETGLTGDFELKAILHYIDHHIDGRLLEDKYFFLYKIENTTGELKEKIEEGQNKWMSEAEFRALEHNFGTFEEMVESLDSPTLIYRERHKTVSEY